MLKLLVYISLIVFFSACGVETSSSSETVSTPPVVVDPVEEPKNDNADYRLDIVDANPIVDYVEDNVSDNNGTDNPVVEPTPNDDQNNSIFDTSGAILDPYACKVGDINDGFTNNSIKDNSNDYLGTNDLEDGLGLTSRYSYNPDPTRSEVVLYYYDLLVARFYSANSIVQDNYTVSLDNAWGENDYKTIYVRTPQNSDDLYGCYRFDLSLMGIDGSVSIAKVYRLKE